MSSNHQPPSGHESAQAGFLNGTARQDASDSAIDLSVDVDSDLEDLLDGDAASDAGSGADGEEGNAADPEFAQIVEHAQAAWTDREIDEMMEYLRERGMVAWMKEYIIRRGEPVQKLLYAFGVVLSRELRQKDDVTLIPLLKVALTRTLRRRVKLPQCNTLDDVIHLLRNSERIIVLTGAGISVSCGIPDFRSRNGLYAMLQERGEYELDDPQQMFDINYFRENPSVFYSFANQIYPSNFTPSPCHQFIKVIEEKGKLLRNYTQNIDTLETLAGIQRVLQCHGSFATASCIQCRHRVPGTDIKEAILAQQIPLCTVCNDPATRPPSIPKAGTKKKRRRRRSSGWNSDESDESEEPAQPQGIMKPDITFFGEKLDDDFDRLLFEDRESVDLLLVIGTSLKVAPVSEILTHLPHSVPQIVINKTPIRHVNPDVFLLGDADGIVEHLTARLGWTLLAPPDPERILRKRASGEMMDPSTASLPRRVGQSHVWLFEGADGGSFVEALEAAEREVDIGTPTEAMQEAQDESEDGGRDSKKSRHS